MSELSCKINFTEFARNKAELIKYFEQHQREILLEGAFSFAKTAPLYVPPNMKRRGFKENGLVKVKSVSGSTIDGDLYQRKIINLRTLVRDGGAYRKLFGRKLHEGFEYAVKFDRYGKGVRYEFFQTIGAAARASEIKNRGLLKAMFGLGLSRIGGKVPPMIQKLVKFSPNLSNLISLNPVSVSMPEYGTIRVTIANNAMTGSGSFIEIAMRMASKAADRKMEKELEKLAEKEFTL